MEIVYFSIKQSLEYVGGYWHILEKLQNRFLTEYEFFPDELEKNLLAGENQKNYALIHCLKGITKNLGANALYEASIVAEENILSNSENPISGYLHVFRRTYQEIKAFYESQKK